MMLTKEELANLIYQVINRTEYKVESESFASQLAQVIVDSDEAAIVAGRKEKD